MVPSSRAPRITARAGQPQPLVVELAVEADHHHVGVAAGHPDGARGGRTASTTPGPPAHQDPLPGLDQAGHRHGRAEHVARGGDPQPASLASCSATAGPELLVANTTRSPAARNRAPRGGAGDRLSASHTTPSRSSTHVTAGHAAIPNALSAAPGGSARMGGGALPALPPASATTSTRSTSAVISPPYDVIDERQRAELAARTPTTPSHRPAGRRGRHRPLRRRPLAARRLAGRRHPRHRRPPRVHGLPHGLRRRRRRGPHTTGVIGALRLHPPPTCMSTVRVWMSGAASQTVSSRCARACTRPRRSASVSSSLYSVA